MLDVGDIYQVAVSVKDEDGTLVNPATATLTITLPDGTTETPTVPLPPSDTGIVRVDYTTVQAGLHRWRLTTTGPVTAYADAFSVVGSNWPALVGLGEAKKHLNIPASDTSQDDELRGFVLGASAVVEDIVGITARRTIVETNSGGEGYIRLTHHPVLSVTSIVVDGEAIDAGDYTVAPSGLVAHRRGCFPVGFHNLVVTYVAGRTAVPPNVHQGVLELVRINWRPQQGGNYGPFDGGRSDDFGTADNVEAAITGQLRLGFFVPNTVSERLAPNRRGPVVL